MIPLHQNTNSAMRQSPWQHILWLTAGAILVLALLALQAQSTRARSAIADTIIPLPPVKNAGDHLGMCYANYDIAPGTFVTPLAGAAGARYDRVDFAWDRIEPQQGVFEVEVLEAYDELVSRDDDNGLSTIGILMGTPSWAADCAAGIAASHVKTTEIDPHLLPLHQSALEVVRTCPPRNLYLPWDHPDNDWAQFVRAMVRRYGDRVDVWEIWNEPDLWNWFWTGSVADYAQLLKVGYLAVKAEDPEATVLFAGLAYWANPTYYVAVLDAIAAMPNAGAHNYYFDVMSLHLYSSIYTIRPVAAGMQAAMTARVGPHPIWLTEAGVPLWDEAPADPANRLNRATAEEAAAYMIEAFAEARAAGIDKFIVFRTHDDNQGMGASGPFGLIRDDGTLRPAYVAYQVAATYLHGENQVTHPGVTSQGIQRVTFWGTPRGRVDVLWNTTNAPVTYDYATLLPEVTVVDKRGATTTLPNTGTVSLHLDAATAYNGDGGSLLIGGPPLLVIHSDTIAPASQLAPLPAVWYGKAVTLTWNVADDAGAGHWYTEIELAHTPMGPWTLTAGWPETQYATLLATSVPDAGTWYFRARARDGAGNWETWPTAPEAQTTVFITRTVEISVATYLDANSNGVQDPGESPTSTTALTWIMADGTLIGQHTGADWAETQTVEEGEYFITARAPHHLPARYNLVVSAGPDPRHVEIRLGLKPIKASIYLPLTCR